MRIAPSTPVHADDDNPPAGAAMATTSIDPEDALDMLGLEEDGGDKPADPADVQVEFPPMAGPPPAASSGMPSSIATDGNVRKLAAEKQARDKAEAALKAAQDRIRKLEDDIGTLRKELTQAMKAAPAAGGDAEKLARERDQARAEVEQLKAQLSSRPGKASLPSDDEAEPIPREGVLEQVPYTRLLVQLFREKFSGKLSLKAGNSKRDIFFEEGQPVAHHTSGPGEPLGRVLVAQGRITEEQYLAAARAMVERGAKLTEALLEMGAIDNERLQQEQRQFTRDQIVSGYALSQGSYSLEAGAAAPDAASRFEFRLGEIYVQGYRKFAPDAEVKAVYDGIKDAYVRARSELHTLRPQLALDQEDERILKMLGEAYTVAEAVERSGVDPDRGSRLLASLKTLGLISEWKPGVGEFEARLKADKIRQTEEVLALKQKLREREEQLMADFQKSLQRIESMLQTLTTAPAQGARADSQPPAPSSPPPASATSTPASPTAASGTGRLKKPTMNVVPAPKEKEKEKEQPSVIVEDTAKVEDGPGHDRYREGMRQAAAGRLDEAETALREAVRLDATRPAYLTALARVLLANPRYERSGTLPVVRSLLDRAQTLAPGDAEVTALLQRIQQEMA